MMSLGMCGDGIMLAFLTLLRSLLSSVLTLYTDEHCSRSRLAFG